MLAAAFHPMDDNLVVTCGKSHLNFWTIDSGTLVKRQGLFEVMTAAASQLLRLRQNYLLDHSLSLSLFCSLETREAEVRVVRGVR